ncbi:MAG: SDR family NAD(P)-dependent oxidoreductase [Clostridia bacterium]|nr:SDR family NAD(P)-dependent oxidoreductase [Clostridia bacterium]
MALSEKTKRYIRKNCKGTLADKRVIITGANGGIGYKTAETLVYLGASVILACRNPEKAERAKNSLLEEYPGTDIRTMTLDVADFKSIDAFAENMPDVDVFINNAGVFHRPGQKTKDGFETVMGTNYMGVYYIGEKVLPKLEKCGHDVAYINTISLVHKIARVDFDRFYDNSGSYFRSKLCVARYSEYLNNKYKGTNIHIFMTHPGITITSIAAHIFGRFYVLAKIMPFNSVEKSSLSAAWLLTHDVTDGGVVGPNKLLGGWGYPEINKKSKRAQRDIEPLINYTQKEIEKVNLTKV